MSDTPRSFEAWWAGLDPSKHSLDSDSHDAALLAWEAREAELAAAKAERDAAQAKYDELIYQVGTKWPNETRHETALRYIKRYENSLGDLSAKADDAVAAKVK